MDNTQNIISFCTGYGGIELGIKRTGLDVRTIAYVEIEAFAVANLVAKIEQGKMDAAPVWTNLKTFDGRPFRDKVHGIIGGYPCQPFSNAGQRKGTDDPRHLFPYICEHIRTIRPLWCFFENVGGHLNLGFDEVYKSIRDLGYSVEAGLFTAAEVGAPHKRERLFILAYSEGMYADRDAGELPKQNEQQATERPQERIAESGSASDVGNAQCSGLNRKRISVQSGRQNEESIDITGAGEKLDNPTSGRLIAQQQDKAGKDSRERISEKASCELANADSQRTQRGKDSGPVEGSGQNGHQQPFRQDCWPARPGQPQYDWEEPRTIVGYTKKLKDINKRGSGIRTGKEAEEGGKANNNKPARPDKEPRTVESGMGRTVNGFASRVDELRLLGNGVVPQTAELAFRTLWNKKGQ